MRHLSALAVCAFIGSPALADLNVEFVEGAPKDRFVVTNSGSCDLEAMRLTLDLSTSEAGVIFDVTGSGAGVEVFQPFEITSGSALLVDTPRITDGDQAVTLHLKRLPRATPVAFTIDVDDTRGQREITVADSEMRGATASVQLASQTVSDTFGEDAVASIRMPECP